MEILKQYISLNENIIEYTRDGVTVSHVVRTPVQTVQPPLPPVESTDQKIARLEKQVQADNLVIMETLATIFEEVIGGA